MEVGLRILALIIDLAVCFGSYPLLMLGMTWSLDLFGVVSVVVFPLWFLLLIIWPILFFGIPTGLWGRTAGKFVCRLTVQNHLGDPPGVWRALGRETLKLLSIGSGFGALFTLAQIIAQGGTWYDSLCGTDVQFNPYIRLTATQKKFRREYMNRR